MAAFQFPDPAVTTTVVNPETGITYQWKADPGKWVIVGAEPEDDGCVSTILTFVASSASSGEFHNRNNAFVDNFYLADTSWAGLINNLEKVTLYIDGVEYLDVEVSYQTNSSGNIIATYFTMPLGTAPDFVVGEKYKFSYCPPAVSLNLRELSMQLRGRFELNSNGDAILPEGVIVDSTEADYDDIPDGVNVIVMKPGIFWFDPTVVNLGYEKYNPKTITHLMILGYRLADVWDENYNEIYSETTFTPEFEVGDIIHVTARGVDLYNDSVFAETFGLPFNDVWRVKSKINIVDDNNVSLGWSLENSYAYEVEKCVPDDQYTQTFWGFSEMSWVPAAANHWYEPTPVDSQYVKKTGDTMTGPLTMDNASEIQMTNTGLNFQAKGESLKDANGDPVLDGDGDEQWNDQVNRFIDIESQVPRLIKSDGQIVQHPGKTGADIYGINFDLSGGNTYKNTLQVSTKDDWIFRVASGGTPTIRFNDTFDLTKNPTYDIDNGVAIRGIPTPGDNTPSDFAVNKDYVDTKDEELRQDIIEVEEELEAIAPSLERGTWVFNPIGAAGVGQYGLFALGTSTNEYPQADHLFINSVDSTGKIHNFDDVGEGTYLEIFSPDDGDFGLYQVVENNGGTQGANSYWDFTLNHLQSNRVIADAEGLCRFKFFELAEGADPKTFVLKRGDTMTGNLEIIVDPDSSGEKAAALVLEGRRTTATESCATVAFQNENVTDDYTNGYLTYFSFGNNQNFKFNKDLKVEGNVTATNELHGTVLNSAKDSNLSIQRNNETKILVGSDAVQVQRPIKFVGSSFATDDDHAIHKGYVDEQIANIDISGGGISGNCVELNGGSLCAAAPNPRFYDLSNWTDNQKVGRKPFSTGRSSTYHFYSGKHNKWVYVYRDGTTSSSSNKLRFSTADGLDDNYTGGSYYRSISNPSSSLIKFGTEYMVSGDYIYYHEVSYNASSSSSKKHRSVYAWNWTNNTLTSISLIYASYTNYHKFYIDYKGNVYCRGYQTYYNNGSEYQYYVGYHNPRTDERESIEPSRKVAADLLPHLLPTTDTQAPGLWWWYGGTNSSLSSSSGEQKMMYTWTDENDEWQTKDITSLMPRTNSTFNSNRTNRTYVRTNKGAITRDLLWVYDAPGLNEGEAYVFGIFHSGSFPTKTSVDDNLTFDIWRAKVTLSEIQNINWLTLFDDGHKVFHGPGFCERLDYIAGEIVTRTRSGAVSTTGNTAGATVKVYPDSVVAGTLDGGENWQQRPLNSKNPTERNYYAYRLYRGDHNIFQPYYSDEFIYYYVQDNYDIKAGTLANAEGQIDAGDYIPKDNGETGYFQLTFVYPVNESQPLYWNGVDIGKPFEPDDLNFLDYPPLPQADQ